MLPTDTVYGIACDAFTPSAVQALRDAKGHGRARPPAVLVGSVRAATALVEDLGLYGQDLIDEFWPGALTLVCRVNRNLSWDLGDTKGTVAVRMPLHDLTLELLKETGPLAVSGAATGGRPAARTAAEAESVFGDTVSIYLDGGASGDRQPSTLLDLTGPVPRLLRAGPVSESRIRAVTGVLLTDEEDRPEAAGDVLDPAASPVSLDKKPASTEETAAQDTSVSLDKGAPGKDG